MNGRALVAAAALDGAAADGPDRRAARRALAGVIDVEPTPIRQFEAASGQAEFTAFNLGNVSLDMPQQVERLERHGGVLAADGGGHAYFDLWPRLGLHVEALPPAANDSVYPHPHAVP